MENDSKHLYNQSRCLINQHKLPPPQKKFMGKELAQKPDEKLLHEYFPTILKRHFKTKTNSTKNNYR